MTATDSHPQSWIKNGLSFDKIKLIPYTTTLTRAGFSEHHIDVRRIYGQTQKFWDSYSHRWRHTRLHDAAGFFTPVEVPSSGYMPGVCGLQHGANRNKHVALQRGDRNSRQLLPIPKTYVGDKAMTAITQMGDSAYNLAHLLQTAASGDTSPQPAKLTYTGTNTGIIAMLGNNPVAWIYAGAHTNQNQTCIFWDVAYHRQESHGRSLETAFFNTFNEAAEFVDGLFEEVAA